MADKIYLTMKDGSEAGERFFFEQKNIAIGRTATKNDLILNDPSVSDKHATINCEGGQFFLQDIDSTNGTFLKGARLGKYDKVLLNQGDEFKIGHLTIEFSRIPDQKDSSDYKPSLGADKRGGNQKQNRFSSVEAELFLQKYKRFLIMGAALLFILIFIKVCSKSDQSGQDNVALSSAQSKKTIPLPASGDYGLTRKGDKSHPDKAVFSFIAKSRMVDLHYSPGGIDSKGEVVILLNGTKIADVPLAVDRWQDELTLPLQRKLIVKGGKNQLVFDNLKNPPGSERWGVKKISVEFLPLEPCDEIESKRFLDIAENLYNERKVSMGNLLKSSKYYRKALAKVEECRPEPEVLNKAEKRLTEALKELDSLYNASILAFKKSANLKEYKEAADILRTIKGSFPDERDYRNKEAKRLFERLKKFLDGERK